MTRKERVLAAFHHEPVDRVPVGELSIDAPLAARLLGRPCSPEYLDFTRDRDVRELLDFDIVVLGDWPSWEVGRDERGFSHYRNVYGCEYYTAAHSRHIAVPMLDDPSQAWTYPIPDIRRVSGALVKRYHEETDFFVMGQIGGPVSMLDESLDFEDFLVWALTDTEDLSEAARRIMIYEVEKAKLFLDAGADGIVLADDMAYNSGLFLSPAVMRKLVYPHYAAAVREIKRHRDVPVVLHSDGNLMEAMDELVACGFDGLQSLQPSAGMDIGAIRARWGDRLTLWGNLDLDYLMTMGTPAEVAAETRRLIDTFGETGYILSTCNTLIDPIPTANVLAMAGADRRSALWNGR